MADGQDPLPGLGGVPYKVKAKGRFKHLTIKERLFVYYYLTEDGDSTKAARLAGYADPNANGARIRDRPWVRAAIESKLDTLISGREVLERLAAHARGDLTWLDQCYEEKGPDGYRQLNLKKVRRLGMGPLIKAIQPGKYGDRVELYDAQRALELLGKHHRLFADRVEERYRDLDLDAMSDEDLERLSKRLKP